MNKLQVRRVTLQSEFAVCLLQLLDSHMVRGMTKLSVMGLEYNHSNVLSITEHVSQILRSHVNYYLKGVEVLKLSRGGVIWAIIVTPSSTAVVIFNHFMSLSKLFPSTKPCSLSLLIICTVFAGPSYRLAVVVENERNWNQRDSEESKQTHRPWNSQFMEHCSGKHWKASSH